MASFNKQHGDEPPMFLQRPSSARSQDVSHVLAKTFRHIFTRDTVPQDTVRYLTTSKGGDDPYHEKYVSQLQKVQEEHDRRLAEAAMLERHIMQAQARAMSADERALKRLQASTQGFPDLGLPPSKSHLRSCLDTALLRKYNLLTPQDFSTEEAPMVPPPSAPDVPSYARNTESSQMKAGDDRDAAVQSPLLSLQQSYSNQADSETDSLLSSVKAPAHEGQIDEEERNLWKSQISAETRMQNRNDLANLEARVNHLKNPRNAPPSAGVPRTLIKAKKRRPKEVCIKPKPEPPGPVEPVQIFQPSPPVITFEKYEVGQVYEMTFELKNITTVLRPVRVIPPATSFFSVGLGQFPGEHGLVAPGMSCHYKIRFIPDSLSDFDDVLTVQSQASEPLIIPLRGRRPPPVLTLPEHLKAGDCLVGGVKMKQFSVSNTGGAGKFCIMPKLSWPPANAKSVASQMAVKVSPFEIRPAIFELKSGQSMVIEVLFAPREEREYSEEVVMVCDNCHLKHFNITGKGQTAQVELVTVEGGLSEALPGEQTDLTAQSLVRMETLNPFTYVQKTITIRNLVDIDLPFNWVVVKPYIKQPPISNDEDISVPSERVQDLNATFSMEPEKGTLPPNAAAEFTLTFAPPEVDKYHNALHLVLHNIPCPETAPTPQFQDSESGEVVKCRAQSVLPPIEPRVTDMTVVEIEVKGECEPLQVLLQPYAINIPGEILVETAIKRQFRMLNHSKTTIIFQWENLNSSTSVVQVEPPIGELGAQCEMDFELCVCGNQPGPINHTLLCYIQHMEEPITFNVQAHIKGAEIQIEQPSLNYGLLRLGEMIKRNITINNMCRVPANWSIAEAKTHASLESLVDDVSEFTFTPCSGTLSPLDSLDVTAMWEPRQCKSLSTIFTVEVEGGNQKALSVTGEAQLPEVCLMSCKLHIDDVYEGVASCQQAELINQTLLPTTYQWKELEGSDAKHCSVTMEPSSGSLPARTQLPVNVYFTPHTTGKLTDLRVACEIDGMDNPLYLSLSSDVQGLSVSYRAHGPTADTGQVTMTEDDETRLDFGNDVMLGDTPVCLLYIKNNSAITAPFSVSIENFFAKPPSPPEPAKPNAGTKSQRRNMLLGKTPNIADPLSRTPARLHADMCKAMLQVGKGAAFIANPASGLLQPFTEQTIEVKGFSDMWGDYVDNLVCKVGELEARNIAMEMKVSGNPLVFQMVAGQPNQAPCIRFGSHVSGAEPIHRNVRVNNPSPFDIRVDWQEFNVTEGDKQLLDFVVTYGQPFPLKDRHGEEIIAEPSAPVPQPRLATDLIPNTPDSSPAISREDSAQTEYTPTETEKVKVIGVTMRTHEGRRSCVPFTFTPSQMIVPARGHASVDVSFTPHTGLSSTEGQHCTGYALGYLSLEDQIAEVDRLVKRDQHYDVMPMHIDMTAHVKPPLLMVECSDEEMMRYRAAASDLVLDGALQQDCLKLCSATLHNTTETPLIFNLMTQEPFYVVELDPVSRMPADHMVSTGSITLKPRQSAVVHVGFRIGQELLKLVNTAPARCPDSPQGGITQDEFMNGQMLHFEDDLMIKFNNNAQQRLPLYATLSLPRLMLSRETVDFGTCLVGQQREVQLVLTNPTPSHSFWNMQQESCSGTCIDTTFAVTPSSGYLEAHATNLSNNKILLQVFFMAKHSEDYEAVYLVQGMLGEPPVRLHLIGAGSYDGKHEAVVGV